MFASEIQAGDEFHDAEDNVVWTALQDVQQYSITKVYTLVEWALDGGQSERIFVGDREMPGLVRPSLEV